MVPELVVEVFPEQRQVEEVKRRLFRSRRSLLRSLLAAEAHLVENKRI
jgi:hypothetical protein